MNPQNEELTITSIQAIGNIAAEGHWERDCILKNNFLQKVIEFNQVTSSEKYRQWSLWAVNNLFLTDPPPQANYCMMVIPYYQQNLMHQDLGKQKELQSMLWALFRICQKFNQLVKAFVNQAVFESLVKLFDNSKKDIIAYSLKLIGQIFYVNDIDPYEYTTQQFLQKLECLIQRRQQIVIEEAIWVISNLCANDSNLIQRLMDQNLISEVLLLGSGYNIIVLREVIMVIFNISSIGNAQQVQYLVNNSAIEICQFVIKKNDSKMVMVGLNSLRNILQVGNTYFKNTDGENQFAILFDQLGGPDDLTSLQRNPNNDIYCLAKDILEEFYDVEEEVPILSNELIQAFCF